MTKRNALTKLVYVEPSTIIHTGTMAGFSQLGIDDWLVQQCKSVGLKSPTPIQQHCTEPILEGTVEYG